MASQSLRLTVTGLFLVYAQEEVIFGADSVDEYFAQHELLGGDGLDEEVYAEEQELIFGGDGVDETVYEESQNFIGADSGDQDVAEQSSGLMGGDGLDEQVYEESQNLIGADSLDEDVAQQSSGLLGGDGLDEKVYEEAQAADDDDDDEEDTETLVEEVRDIYNCLKSEGYTWCETLVKCLSSVEECTVEVEVEATIDIDDVQVPTVLDNPEIADEPTTFGGDEDYMEHGGSDVPANLGGEEDENGCLGSAGYSYCEKKDDCVRPWLLEGEWDDECTVTTTSLGGERDEHDCLGSAGYSYCEKKDDCVRPWLLAGEWDDECTVDNTASTEEDDFDDYFYNEDGSIKPWVYHCLSGVVIMSFVMLLCLVCAKKRMKRRRRRRQGVQMLAEDTDPDNYSRFVTNESNFVFQETIAVKETTKTALPNRSDFTNLV